VAKKNNNMKQISILGCGWLGLPLAKALLEKRFSVKGSTTSEDKMALLQNAGINPYLILLESDGISGNCNDFLNESETLIIDIPPKLRGNNATHSSEAVFVKKMQHLIPYIEKSTVKKVLFVSSTSVYPEDNSIITEDSPLNPETESGKQLVAVETLLQKNAHFKTTIVRFGGLIGEDRHPIPFLAGKRNLENPKAPINLIDQEDCIGIILEILQQVQTDKLVWGETFNAVAPFHPSREEYYTQKAIDLGLELPQFNLESPTFGKTILSTQVETVLGYTFVKPNL
jgi:nucleoside-diphosphate-sugar epimerase